MRSRRGLIRAAGWRARNRGITTLLQLTPAPSMLAVIHPSNLSCPSILAVRLSPPISVAVISKCLVLGVQRPTHAGKMLHAIPTNYPRQIIPG